jgi:putative ABC transport system permease protein
LGARPADILQLVLKGGVKQCGAGLVGGGGAGWLIARPLQSVLANIQAPVSGAAYVAVAVMIGGAVLLALWLPARRAAKVDPAVALRAE